MIYFHLLCLSLHIQACQIDILQWSHPTWPALRLKAFGLHVSCCETRAWSQGAPSLARTWLLFPWQGLREPEDLQATPGSELMSSYIQKQTVYFFRIMEFGEEKGILNHSRSTQQLVMQTAGPSSHCHRSFLFLETSLIKCTLEMNAGPEMLGLTLFCS